MRKTIVFDNDELMLIQEALVYKMKDKNLITAGKSRYCEMATTLLGVIEEQNKYKNQAPLEIGKEIN